MDVRINNKGVAQSKNLPDGQKGVPNFGFVVFEDEKAQQDCLSRKPIYLPNGHRLNVETKKKNVRIFFCSVRFYVKSFLRILEVQNLAF